jgi:glycosyl transferase family 25
MMYEDMLTNNFERIMIFEDDALPDPERLKQIPQILSEIPADCELLMWGWSKNGDSDLNTIFKRAVYNIQRSLGILKWDHTIIKNLFAKPFSSHLKKAGFHDYTYAYAINRSAAEKLLQMQSPIQYIADNLLAHAVTNNLVNGYIVYPAAFLHDNLPDGTARDSYIR